MVAMISDGDREVALELKRKLIEAGVPVREIAIFGSRARGDCSPDSDMDVLEQADRAMHQAELLRDGLERDGVVNRAYYSMFYAALALLLTKSLGASKHSAVLAPIDREFVVKGLLPAEMSAALRDAFNQRQITDHAEFSPATEGKAREILDKARIFLAEVKSITAAGP